MTNFKNYTLNMTSLKQWKRISIQIFEIMIGITVYCFSMDEVVQHAWHIKVIVKVRSCCQFANTCRSPVINRHWLPRFLRHQCHLILFEALRPKCWTLLEKKKKTDMSWNPAPPVEHTMHCPPIFAYLFARLSSQTWFTVCAKTLLSTGQLVKLVVQK